MLHIENQLVHGGLTGEIIGAAMEVHKVLGPGFVESVYEEALAREFAQRGIMFERQKTLPVQYKGEVIKNFVCDFLVEKNVIVEIKAIKELGEIEKIQVISYLKASGIEVGLLMNFGGKSLDYARLIKTNQRNPRNP